MMVATRKGAWLFSILAFLICLPPAFFVGITLIGHARPFPYMSVWLDRVLLITTALGLPLLAGYAVHRFVSGRRIDRDSLSAELERAFPGRAKEAGMVLSRYGTEAHEREPERVRLAAVELCGGDITELNRLIDMAKQDYRDILMWAEQLRKEKNRS
jgi:hypothetical protein